MCPHFLFRYSLPTKGGTPGGTLYAALYFFDNYYTSVGQRAFNIASPQAPGLDRFMFGKCMYDILQSSKSASSTQHTRGKYRQTG